MIKNLKIEIAQDTIEKLFVTILNKLFKDAGFETDYIKVNLRVKNNQTCLEAEMKKK